MNLESLDSVLEAPAHNDAQGPAAPGAGPGTTTLLWILLLMLTAGGIVMVYSASSVMALKNFDDPYYFLKKQGLLVPLGLILTAVFSRVSYRYYDLLAKPGLLLAFIALVLVWIPSFGVELNGARRWFRIGGLQVQPSEYAKIAWVVYLSAYCARKQERLRQFKRGLLPPLVLLGLLATLMVLQSDFGSVVILGALTFLLLLAAGARWSHFLLLTLPVLAVLALVVLQSPYRMQRIMAFWNPWVSSHTSGYQLIQSWIAVGSGGLVGKGLGSGYQKMFYLPEPFTDFILAVIGEELGWFGILVTVLLFAGLILTGLRVARSAPDALGAFLAYGLAALFFVQSFINMGVVLGLLPTKGLALPLISYGGSSFTASCVAVGLLINIARESEQGTSVHV